MVGKIAWLGGQSDLFCVLHSTLDLALKSPLRSLSTIHDPLSDDEVQFLRYSSPSAKTAMPSN
jgi:hypothetical protein